MKFSSLWHRLIDSQLVAVIDNDKPMSEAFIYEGKHEDMPLQDYYEIKSMDVCEVAACGNKMFIYIEHK